MGTDAHGDNRHETTWYRYALGFLLLAAILGTIMRYMYVVEIPWLDYKHVLHAHSHVALLGWGFTVIAGALLYTFLGQLKNKTYYLRILFLNVVAGLGMFIFFLMQGYGAISIAFSTMHVIVAYVFCYRFLKDIRNIENTAAVRLARWAVYWMLLSTVGLLGVGIISATVGKLHPLYHNSVQLFLHLQFNGWFTYAILALLARMATGREGSPSINKAHMTLLHISVILTYALSVTWSTPEAILFYLNSAGVVIQLVAVGTIVGRIIQGFNIRLVMTRMASVLLVAGIVSLLVKIAIQTAVAIPALAEISYTVRNFVVGFIHLIMLGSITLTVFAILLSKGVIPNTPVALIGYGVTLLGFVSTELLLFVQGLWLWLEMGFFPNYHRILLGLTALLPVGILLVNLGRIKAPEYTPSINRDMTTREKIYQHTISNL